MSQYSIVAEMVQSNKSNNNVWFVHVTGCDNPELQGYCKHAIKAMQFCFVLKARTQYPIEDSTMEQLKSYYAENEKGKLQWYKPRTPKEEAQPTEALEAPAEVPALEHQTAKRGRRRSKKTEEVAA